ncbi:MAG: bifunctional diaminohydroxyphosphoribosylaminopyrimidine deaminase/5-amino-6-(5-phosphoribosylamino)uracil reductase RibD [Acidobacteriaceae bacterium]
MPLTPHDEQHLQRALDLAQAAVGLASPNPTVGCVLTSSTGEVLGEGAHHYDAFDHAEIAALKQATARGHDVHGATAYVTLEPCAHHGRTGPCSDALIAAGIARCVVAAIDPNPLTRNLGLAKMREAGLTVDVANRNSPLAQQARHLNDAFAFSIQHHRPFVTLKAALSVDGKLAPPPRTRATIAPHWITGTAARADAQQLRHTSDAILTGIGTVLADNPSLTDRTALPRRRPLLRVVLDSALRTPLTSTLVTTAAVQSQGADLLILCSEDTIHAPTNRAAALTAAGAEVLRIPSASNHLDPQAALAALAQRNILSVLVEAGSNINGTLLRADFVDKLVFYYAESELGLDAVSFAANYDSPYAVQQRLTQTTRATFPSDLAPNAEDIRITGYLHDPWSGA